MSLLSHSRPDLCCLMNWAAQVTEAVSCKTTINEFNEWNKRAGGPSAPHLKFSSFSFDGLIIKIFADTYFANKNDLLSQLRHLTLLWDKNDCIHILEYSSRKYHRIVNSVIAAELFTVSDGFDKAYFLQKDLSRMICTKIPIHMYMTPDKFLTQSQQDHRKFKRDFS